MNDLKIDLELKDLLPPLTEEEYKQLEKNILTNGFDKNFPIITWNGFIVDGHNRYSICRKHNIEYTSISKFFNNKKDIINWIILTQIGRRNLTIIQRIIIADKFKSLYLSKAKENKTVSYKNDNKQIDTRKELAKIANVGSGTLARYNVIMKSNNEEIKQLMLKEELSITSAYDLLKKKGNKSRKPIPSLTIKHLINRTNGKCEICNWGGLGLEGVLLPHHINKYSISQNNNVDEIIMLCPNCHGIIHTLENCKDEGMTNKIINNIETEIKDQIMNCVKILKKINIK